MPGCAPRKRCRPAPQNSTLTLLLPLPVLRRSAVVEAEAGSGAARWAKSVFSSSSAVETDPRKVEPVVQAREGAVGAAASAAAALAAALAPAPAAALLPPLPSAAAAACPATSASPPPLTAAALASSPLPRQGLLHLFREQGVGIPLQRAGPCQYRLGSARLAVRLVNGRLMARAGAGQTVDVLAWLEKQPVAAGG